MTIPAITVPPGYAPWRYRASILLNKPYADVTLVDRRVVREAWAKLAKAAA